ncbi:MAG: RNA polymerase sigma factor [Candidatus Dojkabacteria bacterium]|nr:RNA polymerase sigma factor [Candidatus Dojkabacteria bacterium]MDQ7020403.1 RNA polymerase sigma factor [Candidatus Dojkabacteria bacterium]
MLFEKRVIEKAKNGDSKSREKLYREHFKSLYIFVRHKVNTNERAEDIVSESFLRAFEKLENFKGNSSFKSWLYTIGKHLVYDWYKSKDKTALVDDENLDYLRDENNETEDNESQKSKVENEKIIKALLGSLKPRYKEVLELRFLLNYSLKETAKIMETTVGNVKVLQNRAIKKAKELAIENKK